MATENPQVVTETEEHVHEESHYHPKLSFIRKYVFSMDHKTIAKQFLITGIFWGVIGGLMSMVFRLKLGFPDDSFPFLQSILGSWAPEGDLKPEFYNALITIHGTVLVFFVLTAGLSGTFANLLIPLQVGARDMASPFLNMMSYWFFFLASVVMFSSLFLPQGPASPGWTVYPPQSALPQASPGSGAGMTYWLVSMALFIFSALLGGLNYIVTILNMRTKGMSMARLPLTIWAFLVTAILGVLSFPVLLSASVLLIFDRGMGTSFFLSDIYIAGEALRTSTGEILSGGSPILFQHLFWFLGHPEVYIIILPAMGIVSEVLAVNARKPIFGYRAMVGSLLAIGFLSFVVWAHHMFVTGMNPFIGSVFMLLTLIIAVPSAIKVFNWVTTLWKGNIRLTPAMLFSIGFVSTFIAGGLTGLFLGNPAIDIQLHDTYFIVAHFHIVMALSAIFGMFAGIYHWFPKMFGRMMNKNLGYLHFFLTIVCAYGVFWPMHYIGMAGVPRRYFEFSNFQAFGGFADLNQFITVAAIIGFTAQFLFIINFFYSIFHGRKATMNPWKSVTIEWTTPIKTGHGNWPGEIPEVHRWAYDYSKNGDSENDFIPQTTPVSADEIEPEH
ncbi:MAG: cbb3-type cytochrome c oxidase subunit I [Bacteroidetes bacterium]|nr:cbb3-type cytochrome c oxidase subunit I [Bacteroidota bacterium]